MPMMIGASSLFVILSLHTIFGCSSTTSNQVKQKESDVTDSSKNDSVDTKEIPDVDTVIGWKNRGFGSPEPIWITKALSGDFQSIRDKHPEFANSTLILVHAAGFNLDYLENYTASYDVAAKVPAATDITSVDYGWIQIRPAASKNAVDYYEHIHVYACQQPNQAPSVILLQAE